MFQCLNLALWNIAWGSCTRQHLIVSHVLTWQIIQWPCNVMFPYPRRRRPPLLTGFVEEALEFDSFLPTTRSTGEWEVYADEQEDTRASRGVEAINSAARKPVLCYGERRDHSSAGLFVQAHFIDFLILAACIDFVTSVTVDSILNPRHVLGRNSCGRLEPKCQ